MKTISVKIPFDLVERLLEAEGTSDEVEARRPVADAVIREAKKLASRPKTVVAAKTAPGDLARSAINDMKAGIKEFGSYTYEDKGPHEVMDVGVHAAAFREAGSALAIQAFHDLVDGKDHRQISLAAGIVGELEDWDELWDHNEDFLGTFY